MEDAGDDGVFVHLPFLKDFFDGERVDDVGFAGFAELTVVSLGGKFDGALDAVRFGGFFGRFFIIGHYDKIIA